VIYNDTKALFENLSKEQARQIKNVEALVNIWLEEIEPIAALLREYSIPFTNEVVDGESLHGLVGKHINHSFS
jgi:hypothetical protein